jgi:DNA mismatch endonuclease (patch repair protein)
VLHRRGLRFRVQQRPLTSCRRVVDVVFPRQKIAVFVDGCFWHVCPQHFMWPHANAAWWRDKLTRNQVRDTDTDERLRAAGWTPFHVWEHENLEQAADRLIIFLERNQHA